MNALSLATTHVLKIKRIASLFIMAALLGASDEEKQHGQRREAGELVEAARQEAERIGYKLAAMSIASPPSFVNSLFAFGASLSASGIGSFADSIDSRHPGVGRGPDQTNKRHRIAATLLFVLGPGLRRDDDD